jgi:hypothetical protein
MRIWDVSPGYLSRQSLLGEHRELHGMYNILTMGKRGYSRHPETIRWVGCLSGVRRRHAQLVAEMALRGYVDRTPLHRATRVRWPDVFVTTPADQYVLLGIKYGDKDAGRIRLPRNCQELWAHHKYSVMARDPAAYRTIGRRVARLRRGADSGPLAEELVQALRADPPRPRLINALEHMWGYVSDVATVEERRAAATSAKALLMTTREIALRVRQPYLVSSTALSELAVFL